ncbi:MAG: carbamoyltransferase HypF [bacterium]|nr:carbamoyltransferase HypF [bacterium]
MNKHLQIRIKGIVQGVGFRPFIHELAGKHGIRGSVINDTEGVLIEAEGDESTLNSFIRDIADIAPPLSFIRSIESTEKELLGFSEFSIGKSKTTGTRQAFYSPDIALCDECLGELKDPDDRRYQYPFITCINCGPRFSIIHDIPYDRENTAMDPFPMCPECQTEYDNHTNRRFHAQPNACGVCGPRVSLYTINREFISSEIKTVALKAVELLKAGHIIAIKGVGGYHLAADALNDSAVELLRKRKKRTFKPFAMMASGIEAIAPFTEISALEKELLLSKERPIVLLKTTREHVSPLTAPKVSSLGFMLPYTPFQHLLFSLDKNMILVMTSANLSDEPIIYKDDSAFKRLSAIADYIISYNRDILAQSDDSVLFVERDIPFFVRRSRGYIPLPFNSKDISEKVPATIMALGGDLKNSFALSRKDFVILSQYLGDMADPLTHETYRETVDHFIKIFDAAPDVVVSDMHPGYLTTGFADELAGDTLKRIKVQHHHAHIVSVMEEAELKGAVIGIAFDGTGYGTDGSLWGSEFLIAERGGFTRAGYFSSFPLPGGENAIRNVWKIGLSLLHKQFGRDIDFGLFPLIPEGPLSGSLMEIIEKKINSPLTCSIGRLFDGVSAILGLCDSISTEAEAAILVEEAALRGDRSISPHIISFNQGPESEYIIRTEDLVQYLVSLLKQGLKPEDIAFAFHASIAHTALAVTKHLKEQSGLNRVVLSGGVFHNRILLSLMMELLEEADFEVIVPRKVPVNDGCIALGQVAVAKEMLLKGL